VAFLWVMACFDRKLMVSGVQDLPVVVSMVAHKKGSNQSYPRCGSESVVDVGQWRQDGP
jgi:hypothetical protein